MEKEIKIRIAWLINEINRLNKRRDEIEKKFHAKEWEALILKKFDNTSETIFYITDEEFNAMCTTLIQKYTQKIAEYQEELDKL